MTPNQTEPTGPRGRVVWKSRVVAVLWTVQAAALLTALVYWFVINANRDEANQRRLADLQLDGSVQIAELRQTVATGLGDLRLQLDARHAQLDTRTTTLERQLVELHSDVAAITRASNVPLPGTRR